MQQKVDVSLLKGIKMESISQTIEIITLMAWTEASGLSMALSVPLLATFLRVFHLYPFPCDWLHPPVGEYFPDPLFPPHQEFKWVIMRECAIYCCCSNYLKIT